MSATAYSIKTPAAVPQRAPLPLSVSAIEAHGALPQLAHDDQARLNVGAAFNTFLAQRMLPAVERAARAEVEPARQARLGQPAADRHEYRRDLEQNLTWRLWSRLRRSNMEMLQQAGRLAVLPQLSALVATCREINAGHDRLELDPTFQPPGYLSRLHSHLMPGGYVAELGEDDVTAGATYDVVTHAVLGGRSGPASDRAGRATLAWLREHRPGWTPRRILDLGCGIGTNTCVLARAFPDAEIIAVDAGAALLRYAAARAASLGVTNIRFIQGDIETPPVGDNRFDLVMTLMVLHETSRPGMQRIFAACREHLAKGGLTFHLEQPPYRDKPLLEQCLRDWDGRYNNEAFWSAMHDTDLAAQLRAAGFPAQHVFETTANAPPLGATSAAQEDYGRGGAWYVVVGEKPLLKEVSV